MKKGTLGALFKLGKYNVQIYILGCVSAISKFPNMNLIISTSAHSMISHSVRNTVRSTQESAICSMN